MYCNNNTALSAVSNPDWINLFKMWNPTCSLPSEIDLTKGLLDDEFKATKEKVEQKISSSLAYGVQIDSRYFKINV